MVECSYKKKGSFGFFFFVCLVVGLIGSEV